MAEGDHFLQLIAGHLLPSRDEDWLIRVRLGDISQPRLEISEAGRCAIEPDAAIGLQLEMDGDDRQRRRGRRHDRGNWRRSHGRGCRRRCRRFDERQLDHVRHLLDPREIGLFVRGQGRAAVALSRRPLIF